MSDVRLLFKSVTDQATRLVNQADILAQVCDIEYRNIVGRPNEMPRRTTKKDKASYPVVCVSIDVAGYWVLLTNDPDIDPSVFDEIARRLRQWENARAMR